MTEINQNPQREFDDYYVICPYCGAKYGDCGEWVKDYHTEMICEECSGVFDHYAEYSVSYITQPVRPPSVEVETVVVASGSADVVSDVLDL
jgi:hypothetical protein